MKLSLATVIALIGMIQADADAVTKLIVKVKAAEDEAAKANLHGAKRDIAIVRAVVMDALDIADTLVDQASAEGVSI